MRPRGQASIKSRRAVRCAGSEAPDSRRIPCKDSREGVCGWSSQAARGLVADSHCGWCRVSQPGSHEHESATTLLFGLDGFRVVGVDVHDENDPEAPREVLFEGVEREQACPACGVLSSKVHARKVRPVKDLPHGRGPLRVRWDQRRAGRAGSGPAGGGRSLRPARRSAAGSASPGGCASSSSWRCLARLGRLRTSPGSTACRGGR